VSLVYIFIYQQEGTSDYLSCEIIFLKDKKKAWLGQPHLIGNLKKNFGEKVQNLQVYKTPGTPSTGLKRPDKDTPELSSELQTNYRSGVGMLLY
jgi:hypothetical protein